MRRIPGYSDYSVNEMGQVFSHKRYKLKQMSLHRHYKGYVCVGLFVNGKTKIVKVHSLVARAYLLFNERLQVNHINGDKGDNRLENLEIVTGSENMLHAFKCGLVSQRGAKNSNSKLSEDEVLLIYKLSKMEPALEMETIGLLFGVKSCTIQNIKYGRKWKHVTEAIV